jgi:magnesium transporter
MSETVKPKPDYGTDNPEQKLADLRHAIQTENQGWVSGTLEEMHPADASDLLEQLSSDQFEDVVELLDGELPSDVLIELRDEYREDAVDAMTDEAVVEALDNLDSDDAIAVLEDLDDVRRERILDELEPEDRAVLEAGFVYDEDTAGRLMQRDFLAAPEFHRFCPQACG